MPSRPIAVMLVDDNDDHCMLVEETLVARGFARRVTRFRDGESALAHLHGGGPGEAGRLPDFILLDLKLVGMSGTELLRQLKNHPITRRIPVVVLTTSERPEDIDESYAAGASGYLVKPMRAAQLSRKLKALIDYWGGAVEMPTAREAILSSGLLADRDAIE